MAYTLPVRSEGATLIWDDAANPGTGTFNMKARSIAVPSISRVWIDVRHLNSPFVTDDAGTPSTIFRYVPKIPSSHVDLGQITTEIEHDPDRKPPYYEDVKKLTLNYVLQAGLTTGAVWEADAGLADYTFAFATDEVIVATVTWEIAGDFEITKSTP